MHFSGKRYMIVRQQISFIIEKTISYAETHDLRIGGIVLHKTCLSCFLNSVHLKYTIIPSIFLSFIAIFSINSNAWIVSDVHHFYFEMFAVVLSAIVAFYCITRAYSLNEKFSLFTGIGFVTVAIIDLLHATLSFSVAGNNAFLDYFIPQTWFAGRTFLGVMLVVAVVKYAKTDSVSSPSSLSSPPPSFSSIRATAHIAEKFQDESEEKESSRSDSQKKAAGLIKRASLLGFPHQEQQQQQSPVHEDNDGGTSRRSNVLHHGLVFSLIMLAVLAIWVVVISFFTIFPGIVITNNPVSRPYEIPALIFFSVALFYFYKRKLYKSEDVFYRGILGALIIDIFAQIIMSYSAVNFHTAHNVAHILKDSSYFIVVISLAMSSIQHNKIAKERAEIIRQQYVKLKETDKMKDEFINIAAHELRTPIQPVLGLSQLLRVRLENSSNNNNIQDEHEILDIIIRNAKRLQRLTENILDVTKIESQSLVMNIERFDLNEVIINAIDDLTASADYLKKHKSLLILYQPKHVFIDADKSRLAQVISNLLGNSIKFTSEGSITITVEVKRADWNNNTNIFTSPAASITNIAENYESGEIVVCVQDTGRGIDAEILPNLFSKFTSNHSSGGTGLGLFVSKGIIEAHGGKIYAINNEDDQGRRTGATFIFTLPIRKKNNYYQVYQEQQQKQQRLLSSSLLSVKKPTTTTTSYLSYMNSATASLADSSNYASSKKGFD
jgi:signal transduction histidine kinase